MPPESDLVDLQLEGLRYQQLQPLQRFRVAYEAGHLLSLDLEFTGLRAPHEAGIGRGVGHYDQPCQVVGEVNLQGERIPIDTIGMRDRTWSVRPEDRHGTGTAYTYGHVSADEQFLLLTKLDGTAKGGIALAIARDLGIPVKLIGVGEQLEDLRPFDADDFAKALLTA